MRRYSIIIPVYNLDTCIERTLESLKNIGNDTEVIFVDDGSKDNTFVLIDSYIMNHNLTNMKIIRQLNQGVSVARNRGIIEAEGEYIIFADGDDLISLGCLKQALPCKTDVIVWRFETEKDGTRTVSQKEFDKRRYSADEFVETLLRGLNRIRIGSFAVKRELLNRYKLKFTEGCAICEDVEFMYKVLLSASDVEALDVIGYTYIRREGSASNTYDLKRFQAPVAIERIYQFAASKKDRKYSEYIMDSLKYGLYITHVMYSIDACCRYTKKSKVRKEFLAIYFKDYANIENKIKEAKKQMKYKPSIYSKKRLSLFLFSRKRYIKRVSKKQ